MTTQQSSPVIKNRYEFAIIFDAKLSNPNGDPDAGNMPRTDPETGHGLVTDVCIKRKIRNYIARHHAGTPGLGIYVMDGAVLAERKTEAYKALGLDAVSGDVEEGDDGSESEETPKAKKGKGKLSAADKAARVAKVRQKMIADYADVRWFGAVMSTAVNAGQVRGPVQLAIAESVDPVAPMSLTITRCAVETTRESEAQSGGNRTMGQKHVVPYGLYVMHGYISPTLAADTGFSERDLSLLWEAITQMFDDDRSAARGDMAVREVVIFKHASALGNAQAHKLFDGIKITRRDPSKPPRAFTDYEVTVAPMPPGVECIRLG